MRGKEEDERRIWGPCSVSKALQDRLQKNGHFFPQRIVEIVLYYYREWLEDQLIKGRPVYLLGLARITPTIKSGRGTQWVRDHRTGLMIVRPPKGRHIRFLFHPLKRLERRMKKAKTTEKILERELMKKYGVKTIPQSVKKEAELIRLLYQTCPWCKREVYYAGGQLHCPVHGTEPFEHNAKTEENDD